MKFLRDRAAFSTITVMLQARPSTPVVVAPPPSAPRLPFPWLHQIGVERLLDL